MARVHRPWRDIPTERYWKQACDKEKTGNWSHNTVQTFKRGPLKKNLSVLEYADKIERELRAYHTIQKDNLQLFIVRRNKLRALAAMAGEFIGQYGWEAGYATTWARQNSKFDRHQNLARLALTIHNRGLAKADYLDTLYNFYSKSQMGSTNENLFDLLSQQQMRTSATLGVVTGVLLEKLDPLHRNFESIKMDQDGNLAPFPPGMPSTISVSFHEWLAEYNNAPADTPHFFVWLENQPVCRDDGLGATVKDVEAVRYGDERLDWCKILLFGSPVYWKDSCLSGEKQLADTAQINPSMTGKSVKDYTLPGEAPVQVGGAVAYIWDTTSTIFLFAHEGGKQHHSSANKGNLVQCAGTMIIRNGKIVFVDTDSGHYQPDREHLVSFCNFLQKGFGLTDDDVVSHFGAEGRFIAMTWRQLKVRSGLGRQIGSHRGS